MCTYARETSTMSHDIERPTNMKSETPSVDTVRDVVFPEKKSGLNRLGRRGQVAIAGAIASTLLAGGLFAGSKIGEANNNNAPEVDPNPTAEAPVVPGEQAPEEVTVPEEAKDYVSAYDNVFPDALATYYSEEAYLATGAGPGLILNQEYADSYDFDTLEFANGMVSPLGFSVESMDPNQPIDIDSSIAVFNNSIPNMDRLVNMLAKNPSPVSLDIIKHDFSLYAGISNSESDALVDTFLAVTREYGSNSIYSISPAVQYDSDAKTPESSVVVDKKPGIDAVDENGNITAFFLGMDITLKVETFDNTGNSTQQLKTIEDAQFTVDFAKDLDPGNNGFIGIGYR